MARNPLLVEDPLLIRMTLQRLCAEATPLGLGFQGRKGEFPLVLEDGHSLALEMGHGQIREWQLEPGVNVDLQLRDRGLLFECVVSHLAPGRLEGLETCLLGAPRILRRSDTFRLVDFVPVQPHPCTFTNTRNALLDGSIRGLSEEGLEIVLRDPRQGLQNILRMGEESLLDVTLGEGLQLKASTTVAYFHEDAVGLRIRKVEDGRVLDRYCDWIQEQQALQAQKDREAFVPGGFRRPAAREGPQLPQLRVWVDRDPMLVLLTEKGDFAQRLAEALSRKFGLASLDYIKGPLRPQLKRLGVSADGDNWGRARAVLVHNMLRLGSPLELARQLVEKERCPLPLLLLGTEEDADKKRRHAIRAGAVEYLPVEPFRVLSVFRKIEEILTLIGA
ncbi:MAG: hypothetical protein HY823_11070 [Acidobacteria bacterium]|nr:hypothetical protein [Acidobacteriota bacterium]